MNGNPMQFLMQAMMSGKDPNQIIQQIIQQNPQAKAMINQMQQSGMTPQQFVQQYAKQNNIDMSPIMNMFSQRGIKL